MTAVLDTVVTRIPALKRALLGVIAAGLTAQVVGGALDLGGAAGKPAFEEWIPLGVLLLLVVAAVLRVALVPRDRLAWGFVAAGVVSWCVGEIVWWFAVRPDPTPPQPSVADVFWIAFLPLSGTGLALLVRSRVRHRPASLWLDGLMAGLLGAAVAAAVFIPHLTTASQASAVAVNLAYPLGDVVLVAWTLWALSATSWRPGRAWVVLLAGYALAAGADTLYLREIAEGTYTTGTLVDALWPIGFLLVIVASWMTVPAIPPPRRAGNRTLVAPTVMAGGAICILAADEVVGDLPHWPSPVAVWLSISVLGVSLVRMTLTLRENARLSDLRHQTLHDALTGLPNRTVVRTRLQDAVRAARLDGGVVAVIVLDVDRFKDVNDSLGHSRGDRLLEEIAARLRAHAREGELIARLGGDEFAVVLPRVADAAAAMRAAERLRAATIGSVKLGDMIVDSEASFGVALYPYHGEDADDLLKNAEVAMYVAKRDHAGVRAYARAEDEHSPERLELLGELRRALVNGEIQMAYQPKVNLVTGVVVGVEALMRWNHPRRGPISPGEFIPLAERTSMMGPLTVFALESTLRQLRAWDAAGLQLDVAVNLSARHLIDPQLPERIAGILAAWHVDPRRVELEVTESMLMANPARAEEVLEGLADAGVRIAIDDFGVGHASLNYLTRMPVHTIKVDKSFVQSMGTDARSAAIVRSVVELGSTLGLKVVAEGIEDAGTMEALVDAGCSLGQGYYLGRPGAAEDVTRLALAFAPAPQRRRPAPLRRRATA